MNKVFLTCLCFLCSFSAAYTQNFDSKGITYSISDQDNKLVSVWKNLSTESSISIPSYVQYKGIEYKVTQIAEYAFCDNYNLTKIEIPSTITSIRYCAFSGCKKLENLKLPESLKYIAPSAFSNCLNLNGTVIIPNSVDSIGTYAFYNCAKIDSLILGNSLSKIGASSFGNCKELKTVHVADGLTSIATSHFIFSDCPIEELYIGRILESKDLCIPGSSDYASPFYDKSSIITITIGNKVRQIPTGYFQNCTNLLTCTIGSSVSEIGNNAISAAKIIWLPNTPPAGIENTQSLVNFVSNDSYNSLSNTKIYPFLSSRFEVDGIRYIPTSPSKLTCDVYDCSYNSNMHNIRINNSVCYKGITLNVINVSDCSFMGNPYIKECIIDNRFNGKIGNYAFSLCTSLTGINIPHNVSSLGAYSFVACQNMQFANIGHNLTEIADSTFAGCSSITEIKVPRNINRIGNYVFAGCTALKKVIIEDRDSSLTLGSNDNLPMFADCPLKQVYIGGDISYIPTNEKGFSPFYKNLTLESVIISNNKTHISENEFYGCTQLKDLIIGDNIESIGERAFSGCASLEKINLGSNITDIGDDAFSDCASMSEIKISTTTPPTLGVQSLDDINKWACKLYVPQNSLSSYKAAEQWKEFLFIGGEN